MSFPKFVYMTQNTPFFPILHVFAPLNAVRAYSAWSWKTTQLREFLDEPDSVIPPLTFECPPPRGNMACGEKYPVVIPWCRTSEPEDINFCSRNTTAPNATDDNLHVQSYRRSRVQSNELYHYISSVRWRVVNQFWFFFYIRVCHNCITRKLEMDLVPLRSCNSFHWERSNNSSVQWWWAEETKNNVSTEEFYKTIYRCVKVNNCIWHNVRISLIQWDDTMMSYI